MRNLNTRPHMSLDEGEELKYSYQQVDQTLIITAQSEEGAITIAGKPDDLLSLFHNLIDQVHQSDYEDREMMLMPK